MRSHHFAAVLPALLVGIIAVDIGDFNWESITPSRKLEYHACYDGLQCARLTVPLDWQDPSNNHTVAIAMLKLPATVPDDDPSFGGTIFTNPGGPGGSGVGFMLRGGGDLLNITEGGGGGDDKKHYEILSWDPRGIGLTTPQADCFLQDTAARDLSDVVTDAIGLPDAGESALRRLWARTEAYGKLCQNGAGGASILPFLSTPSVVRDMVEMLDQVHELRSRTAESVRREGSSQKRLELGQEKEVPRILYWGFSYGSYLGNTFASMYPGRVGRLIVDGIVDADDYSNGTWLTNLQDAEKIVDYFYQSCFEAGDKCSLRRPSDTAWQDLKKRVDAFIEQTDLEPISILQDTNITVITRSELLASFIQPLYRPLPLFPRLADVLSSALDGNYTLLLEEVAARKPILHDTCSPAPNATEVPVATKDAQRAILCGDGDDATHLGIGYFRSYVEQLLAQSGTMGAYWSTIRFACSGWTVRPRWRFTGPWTTPAADASPVEGRPAAPLLFLSSRLDPVTPLRNAVAMAKRHPGAGLVVQESAGHCSASVPSECTNKIVREYLQSGKVPEPGTVCEADCDPWNPCKQRGAAASLGIGLEIMG